MSARPKTYLLVSQEYNSNSQQATVYVFFRAESLDQLDSYIHIYQNGESDQIPVGRFRTIFDGPEDFYEAGGFSSIDLSFICRDDGIDMSRWWNKNGWGYIK